MTAVDQQQAPPPGSASMVARIVPPFLLGRRRAALLIERNLLVFKRTWVVIVGGLFEPLFFLGSIGVGIGALVGHLGGGGHELTYTQFVAPGLMGAAAMNGAVYESTFNIFFKLKYAKTYDAVLATPLNVADVAVGEIGWALLRGGAYAVVFLAVMAVMGLPTSWWALVAVPAAVLIGFAFAAAGMAATSYMTTWQDFDLVQMAIVPMFLFSATFSPLATYPPAVQWIVRLTPLYHGVVLLRDLTFGALGWSTLGHAVYLAIMGVLCLQIAIRRLGRLLCV
ncbi:MAG TPA: ABC transporter permease [Acidimicrobiales bacterium]|jgi:lipooligosaccharide transport system permease protein|nr:ABC transporter permease [Acidimicrobiales bacterium]